MGHTAKIIHELKTDPKWKGFFHLFFIHEKMDPKWEGLCVCVCVCKRRRTWLWL